MYIEFSFLPLYRIASKHKQINSELKRRDILHRKNFPENTECI